MSNTITVRTLYALNRPSALDAPLPAEAWSRRTTLSLAESITRQASKQTYATIRLLADRSYAGTAFQAYAYFRWLDDILDDQLPSKEQRLAFLERQQQIIARCYRAAWPGDLCPQETLVADLIRRHPRSQSGIGRYITEMMAVMAFDAGRNGRLISRSELDSYTLALATAVTEALHFCIGHDAAAPQGPARYDAVRGAHITHMLRDAVEDSANGYHNIPREYLTEQQIGPGDIDSPAYRAWVKSRVNHARALFASGRPQIAQVENPRCRLAGYAYIGRFELVLDLIEKDNYQLRATYPERKTKRAALKLTLSALWQSLRR